MDKLVVERRSGGINPLKGRGELDTARLGDAARTTLEACFKRKAEAAHGNEPVYRVTRITASGSNFVDLPEHLMPADLLGVVKDELP
jgi:hypothetical protein